MMRLYIQSLNRLLHLVRWKILILIQNRLKSLEMLHEAKVFITPGFIFGSNGKRFIRISLCCKDERLKEALERIKTLK